MVRKNVSIRLNKELRNIVERSSSKLDGASRSVATRQISTSLIIALPQIYLQNLVDNFALVVRSGNLARVGSSASSGELSSVDQLHPSIAETSVCQLVDASASVGPSVVGVAADNDGSSIGVGLDVLKDLVNASFSSLDIAAVRSIDQIRLIQDTLTWDWLTQRRRGGCKDRPQHRQSSCA